jgi:hypothetical protein
VASQRSKPILEKKSGVLAPPLVAALRREAAGGVERARAVGAVALVAVDLSRRRPDKLRRQPVPGQVRQLQSVAALVA